MNSFGFAFCLGYFRTAWDEEKQEWFFSIVDVCGVLTGQPDYDLAKNYWKVLKHRLIKEGNESVTKCNQLKLPSPKDGKRYATDVADMALMFRIIESIPSKKAEPIKVWMAAVAAERINQAIDPERSIDQAIADYRRLGYSEAWITRRIKTIEIRKWLTDEWKRGGVTKEIDFAFLTDLMSKTWSGMTTREYKNYKGLTKENLRDNMTNMELLLNSLSEEAATQLSKERNPEGLRENAGVAQEGAEVAKTPTREITLLPRREADILQLLCKGGGSIIPTQNILLSLWGDDDFFNARSLQVLITRLRHRFSKDPRIQILNVRGVGYKLFAE